MAIARASVALRTALLNGNSLSSQFNDGYIRIYEGTIPATPETSVGSDKLLAELRFAASASFGTAVSGVATAGSITQDSAANDTGTAGYFRCLASDGSTVLFDGDVTATGGGGSLTLPTTSIVANAVVTISSFTFTLPM